MSDRSADWLEQAQRDLEQALSSQAEERHERTCFAAQQAAELAVKALHLACRQEAWGHVVAKLLQELPVEVPQDLVDKGKVLDNFYVPARYPNGHVEGAPSQHYGHYQSEEAIRHASEIIAFVRARLAEGARGS
jgi:HEPN domain-containing protein